MTSAAAVYPLFLEAIWTGYDPSAATPTIALLDSSYVYSAAHEFLSDVTGVLGTPEALTTVVNTAGVVTADNPGVTGTSVSDTVVGFVVYDDTGSGATSRLWAFGDRKSDGTAILYVSDGTTITVQFPSGRVFSI